MGTTRSGSKISFSPSPSQAGHAPWGALKENSRGSISAMVKPDTGQANFSENTMRLSGTSAPFSLPCGPPPPAFGWSPSPCRGGLAAPGSSPERGGGPLAERVVEGPPASAWATVPSARSTNASPSASPSAVSKLSASRVSMPSRTARRSTTTSTSCLNFLSSAGASAMSWNSPSMRTRVKPAFCHSASSFRYSPLRPRTTGASR